MTKKYSKYATMKAAKNCHGAVWQSMLLNDKHELLSGKSTLEK